MNDTDRELTAVKDRVTTLERRIATLEKQLAEITNQPTLDQELLEIGGHASAFVLKMVLMISAAFCLLLTVIMLVVRAFD